MSPTSTAIIGIDDDAIVRSWVCEALRGSRTASPAMRYAAAEALELIANRHGELLLVDQLGTELVRDLPRRDDQPEPADAKRQAMPGLAIGDRAGRE